MITFDNILPAIRMGFARAASEAGLTPEQAEQKLAAYTPVGVLETISNMLQTYAMAPIIAGAFIGGASGVARNNIEKRISGTEDPEMNSIEKKRQGYQKMTGDLQDNMAVNNPAYNTPRVQEAMR